MTAAATWATTIGSSQSYRLGACWLAFGWVLSTRLLMVSLMPAIAADLALTSGQAGFLLGWLALGYSIGLMASTHVPLPRKTVILASMFTSSLAVAAAITVSSFAGVMLVLMLTGVGGGFYSPTGTSMIMDFSSPRTVGRNLSIHETATVAGMIGSPLFVAATIGSVPWQQVSMYWALVGLVAFLAFLLVHDVDPTLPARGFSARLRIDRTLLLCVVAGTGTFAVLLGIPSVLPTLMVRSWGVSNAEAAAFVGTTRFAGFVSILVGGPLSDRVGRTPVILTLLGIPALALAVSAAVGYGPVFAIAFTVTVLAISGVAPVLLARISELYAGPARTKAVGAMGSASSLMGVVGLPALMGAMMDVLPSWTVFAVGSGLAVLGMGAIVGLRRSKRAIPARA